MTRPLTDEEIEGWLAAWHEFGITEVRGHPDIVNRMRAAQERVPESKAHVRVVHDLLTPPEPPTEFGKHWKRKRGSIVWENGPWGMKTVNIGGRYYLEGQYLWDHILPFDSAEAAMAYFDQITAESEARYERTELIIRPHD